MSIQMTPQMYFDAFAVGNYEDYISNPGDIRCAFNAAITASHLADHYYSFYKRNDPHKVDAYNSIGAYVEFISTKTSGYFRDIRSIANAFKHLYLGGNDPLTEYSSISSTGAVETVYLSRSNLERVSESFSNNNAGNKTVIYTKKSKEEIEFIVALEMVMGFWKEELSC